MSYLTIDDAKEYLNVTHDEDDSKIAMLLAAAEDEALQIMDREQFGFEVGADAIEIELESEPVMPDSVRLGVLILLDAAYQATPAGAEQLRRVAETKLRAYRANLGV